MTDTDVTTARPALARWRWTVTAAFGWLTLAVRNDHGQTAAVAALYFTAFAAGEGLTRIFGGPIVDRLGRVRTIRTTTALGVVGMVLFIQAVNPWIVLIGVLLWAVGVSMGFPLGMSAAAESGPDPAARVSVVASIGYFANLAGPPVIGALAQSVGLLNALWLIVVLFLAAFAAASSFRRGRPPRTGRRPRRRSVRNLPPELRRRDDGRARMHPDAHGGKPYGGDPARASPSVVQDRDEHPRPRRGDALVVGCGGLPLLRPERRLKRPRICEVQLGRPVVSLLTGVSSSHETRRLSALQSWNPGHERHVRAEIVPVEGIWIIGACVQHHELYRHARRRYAEGRDHVVQFPGPNTLAPVERARRGMSACASGDPQPVTGSAADRWCARVLSPGCSPRRSPRSAPVPDRVFGDGKV